LAGSAALAELLRGALSHLEHLARALVAPQTQPEDHPASFLHAQANDAAVEGSDGGEGAACTEGLFCAGAENDNDPIYDDDDGGGDNGSGSGNNNNGGGGGDDGCDTDKDEEITASTTASAGEQDLAGFDDEGQVIGGGPLEPLAVGEVSLPAPSASALTVAATLVPKVDALSICSAAFTVSATTAVAVSVAPFTSPAPSLYKPTVSDAAAHLLACALAGLLPYLGAASAGGGVIHNDAGVSATDVEGPYGALVARLRRSAVFSPSGGGAALMRLPGLQRPLVQLAGPAARRVWALRHCV
jgi:hypothetical protein